MNYSIFKLWKSFHNKTLQSTNGLNKILTHAILFSEGFEIVSTEFPVTAETKHRAYNLQDNV